MILAVVLALGPPLAFLMIPAAGFFLPLLPFWSVGVVGLLIVGFLILGRIPHAIGVAMLAIAGALSPLGTLTLWSVNAVSDVIKLQKAASELIAKCGDRRRPAEAAIRQIRPHRPGRRRYHWRAKLRSRRHHCRPDRNACGRDQARRPRSSVL
ncbi:hypothetical protein H8A99_00145 [Bradyrhizobium sp. Arg68]|uniref:hypothetical protein n=1 Tax=Bradyrhizobium ivorense TaxID=2511166 RepID=UPI001E3A7F1B|nr:hypothetical protein [Bradyrhizobium ivorense]MCC8934948.1 hypothetical protein [Bradyrhizobium ivorense]